MKLPRILTNRPAPGMPTLAGFEPRFDTLPAPRGRQPAEVVRPLYWWAVDLQTRNDLLVDACFDATTLAATVTVQLSSYQVVQAVRRHDDKPQLAQDLPQLIAEAVWRLGVLGWTAELDELTGMLRACGLSAAPRRATPDARHIPGCVQQPDRATRIAYWWAVALTRRGWQLHACGDALAQYGFMAEVPGAEGNRTLVIYPGGMTDDGTEASALANHLARLGPSQRTLVQRIINGSATGEGRVR